MDDSHIFLAVIARAEIPHAIFHLAHACRAKSIPAARVLHGDARIECDLEDRLALRRLDFGDLAVLLDEGDRGHERGV